MRCLKCKFIQNGIHARWHFSGCAKGGETILFFIMPDFLKQRDVYIQSLSEQLPVLLKPFASNLLGAALVAGDPNPENDKQVEYIKSYLKSCTLDHGMHRYFECLPPEKVREFWDMARACNCAILGMPTSDD
ncbi:MAG: hypothetical protein AAGA53_16065 [Pseudomonadota bacterium]